MYVVYLDSVDYFLCILIDVHYDNILTLFIIDFCILVDSIFQESFHYVIK